MIENLLDPAVLCFGFGILGGLLGSDVRLPGALYETLSIYLLLAIGLKGGADLAKVGLQAAAPALIAASLLGAAMPVIAYPVLRLGGLDRANAAALGAHYGSVSAVTYAVCLSFLDRVGVGYEGYAAALVAFMEVPALAVGILLARRGAGRREPWPDAAREILLGKGVYFLVCGLVVGAVARPGAMASLAPVYFAPFKGVLALFLLEMGLVASRRLREFVGLGPFLIGFGVGMPLAGGAMGALLGAALGLSTGGCAVLATLAASSSYIAAPAAMRLAVPEANPSIYLTTSLGVTFPFNLVWGIPLYLRMAQTAKQLIA